MVQKFLRFFDREMFSLHQAAFFLALAAVGSKILALLRDRFLASAFGAGKTLDIYYASFVLPDHLYTLLLFIVSSSALIPIFLEKVSLSREGGRKFLSGVFAVFFLITAVLASILFFLMPYLVPLAVPGFSSGEQAQVVLLSRILLLSPFLLGLSNLISSVIQSLRRFLIYALAPIFYNIGIILGVLVFEKWWGLKGIIFGVVLGALLHLTIQIPSLLKADFFPRFILRIDTDDIKRVIKLSFPRALGIVLSQPILTVITAIASLIGPGSIAVFNLANNLQTIPLTVIAMSYGTAVFPILSELHIKKEKEKFLENVIAASRHIIFWSLPITVIFVVLRAQIVRSVLGAGAFTWADTRLTAASFGLLSLAIVFQGLTYLLMRAYYAAGSTRRPLIINLSSSLFIIGGSALSLIIFKNFENIRVFFVNLLRVADVDGAGMLALPFIFSLGAILNTFLLLIFFRKDFGKIIPGLKKTIIDAALASLAIGAVSYFLLFVFADIFDTKTFIGIFLQGFIAGIGGLMVGFLILKILKNDELKEIIDSLRRKFWKKDISVIAPEPEKLQ